MARRLPQSNEETARLGGSSRTTSITPGSKARPTRSLLLTATGVTDRPRDRGGRGDPPRRRPRLLRPDGADRALRRRDPGGYRDALAALARRWTALDALPASLHDRTARLPRHRRPARGIEPAAGVPERWAAPRSSARRGAGYLRLRASTAGWLRGAARPHVGLAALLGASSWRSASACTTSARASRSARPTRSASLALGRRWWWASRSTTPPRAWRCRTRRAREGRRCGRLGAARAAGRRAGRAGRLDRARPSTRARRC